MEVRRGQSAAAEAGRMTLPCTPDQRLTLFILGFVLGILFGILLMLAGLLAPMFLTKKRRNKR
jgi:hypothetical protein